MLRAHDLKLNQTCWTHRDGEGFFEAVVAGFVGPTPQGRAPSGQLYGLYSGQVFATCAEAEEWVRRDALAQLARLRERAGLPAGEGGAELAAVADVIVTGDAGEGK